MQTVQSGFNITNYGARHTIPNMSNEIGTLTDALKSEKIQEYISNRPANSSVLPIHDLLQVGSEYSNKKFAFKKFKKPTYKLENLGVQEQGMDGVTETDNKNVKEASGEDYEASMEDLAVDKDKPYEFTDNLVHTASEMTDSIIADE